MKKLETGQYVRVVAPEYAGSAASDHYELGDVLQIIREDEVEGAWRWAVNLRTGSRKVKVFPREVELMEMKDIRFADIQKGDLIKSSIFENGVLKERIGWAVQPTRASKGWCSGDHGDYVALDSWSISDVEYTLMDRPRNKFEGASIGSLAITDPGRVVYYKVRENEWVLVQISRGSLSVGCLTDDQILAEGCDLITPPESD